MNLILLGSTGFLRLGRNFYVLFLPDKNPNFVFLKIQNHQNYGLEVLNTWDVQEENVFFLFLGNGFDTKRQYRSSSNTTINENRSEFTPSAAVGDLLLFSNQFFNKKLIYSNIGFARRTTPGIRSVRTDT